MQAEEQRRGKGVKKDDQNLGEMWDNTEYTNLCVVGLKINRNKGEKNIQRTNG